MDERFDAIADRPSKIHIIDHEDKVGRSVERLLRYDLLGFDTETYNAFDRHIPAFEPSNGARMRLAQFATPEGHAYVFDLRKVNKKFLRYLFPNKYLCVIQNAKFEMKFLMWELGIYEYGPMFDTFIAEQVLSKGRVAGDERIPVGLDAIVERRLGVELPKDYQSYEWYKDELDPRAVKYAARDALIILPTYQKQRDELYVQSQVRVAELEFGATPPIAWMENNGVRLNGPKWQEVCDKTAGEIESIKDELNYLLGRQQVLFEGVPSINLDSKQQVHAAFEQAGIELPLDPETEQPTLNNKLLENIKHFRAAELYIDYAKKAKLLQSYGPKWLNLINPYDGRIHFNLKQIGAETGRMACNDPNMMQIPKENLYRNCFEAEEGWVFVDKDYSLCELRILGELCRDPNMLKAFDDKLDLHRYTASLLYRVLFEDVTDKQGGMAKNMNFLIVYGGGAFKLATQAGIPIEVAELTMNMYLNDVYPKMNSYLDYCANAVLHNLQATTMTGRIRQYSGDINNKKKRSEIQRNAKNLKVQGTNADITKLALAQCYKAIVKGNYINNIRLVIPIHDEILAEAHPHYAQVADEILEREMLDAEAQYLKRVPCKVDGSITKVWCKDPTPEQIKEAELLMEEF